MKTVSLTVLLACVAVTFVLACDAEQVITNKAAAMDAIKLEKSRQMQRNWAIERERQEAAAAEHVKTIPRSMSANSQKEMQWEQVVAKLQAAAHAESQRMKYKSIKEMNDRIAHRYRVHAEEKMRPPQKEPRPKPPPTNPPPSLQENEVNPVRVDSEAIVQNAKKAVERARNLPRSFKEWEERMKQKMADKTHQQTAAKQNNNNIRVASPAAVNRHASHDDLVKEIEVEGEMMKSHAPYRHVGRSQVINQAARPRDPKTYPMPLPQEQKAWENMVQARLEEIKANPDQWEEMRKRVEEKVEMSGPPGHDYPSPSRYHYPYHSY